MDKISRLPGCLVAVLLTVSGASCTTSATPTSCQVGDVIYPGGALDPADACQSCQPLVDPLGWTRVSGRFCDGGTLPETADAGQPLDAGTALDAGDDAGTPDGGTDAGVPDAGTDVDAGPADAGVDAGSTEDAGGDAGPDAVLGTLTSYTSNRYDELASGDLDGDGLLDLAAVTYQNLGMDVFFAQAGGTLSAPTHYDGADGRGVAMADLNGDGLADVVVTSGGVSVFLNRGDGTLSAPVAYATQYSAIGVALGDVNGDGAPDLVVGEGALSELFLNDGTGTLGPPTSLPAPGGNWAGVAVVDLNKDGRADIAVGGQILSRPEPDGFTVLLSLPDGGFAKTSYPGSGGGVAVVDWRHDGAPDLIAGSWLGTSLSLFRNDGDGHFGDPEYYPVAVVEGLGWVLAADFNGDHLPDLIASTWVDYNGSLSLLYGTPDGGFGTSRTLEQGEMDPSGLALMGSVKAPADLAVAAGIDGGIWIVRTQ